MNEENTVVCKPWRLAIASVIASVVTLALHVQYGHVHWNILQRNYQNMTEAERQKWLSVLNGLEWYRLAGLIAVILAVLSLCRKPRWPALIYGPLAILAGLASLVIM